MTCKEILWLMMLTIDPTLPYHQFSILTPTGQNIHSVSFIQTQPVYHHQHDKSVFVLGVPFEEPKWHHTWLELREKCFESFKKSKLTPGILDLT